MTDYNELQEEAASNLICLLNMVRGLAPNAHIQLQAKYVVADIVRATTQAQIDCLSKGLERPQ